MCYLPLQIYDEAIYRYLSFELNLYSQEKWTHIGDYIKFCIALPCFSNEYSKYFELWGKQIPAMISDPPPTSL